MNITAIIEKGNDGLYSVRSDQEVANHCFGGFGASVDEAKEDFMRSIEEVGEMVVAETGEFPTCLSGLRVSFKYDIASFFNSFDWINVSKFARCVGINESKMRQYKCGSAFAGEKTTNKMIAAVRKIGVELSGVSL